MLDKSAILELYDYACRESVEWRVSDMSRTEKRSGAHERKREGLRG